MYHSFPFFSISGDIKYDLLHYWKSTSLTGDEINAWYEKAVDDQLALLYLKEQENGRQLINAVKMVRTMRVLNNDCAVSLHKTVEIKQCWLYYWRLINVEPIFQARHYYPAMGEGGGGGDVSLV